MFKSEEEVIQWISRQLRFGIRPGLERLEAALDKLGNPHLKLKTLHVAGTNGKGSTVTFLRSVLQEAGYRVGTYTSPFIETFNERISLNDIPIPGSDLVTAANCVYPIVDEINQTPMGPFTEFELITLMSFVYFDAQDVDVVVYEVGMGGRWDATNVIQPLVCGITNVGHDHQEILGDTLVKLAHEKLGIVKKGIPLVTTEEDEELLLEFKQVVKERDSSLTEALVQYPPINITLNEDGACFDWPQLATVQISMKGSHQVKNATLAYGMLQNLRERSLLSIPDEMIRKGMMQAFWKGRFEVMRREPLIVVDGAHNLEGMTELCATLLATYPNRRYVFVASVLGDKDYEAIFDQMRQLASEVHFTSFNHVRAQTGKAQSESYGVKQSSYEEDYSTLLMRLISNLTEVDCLIVTGSLYFISEVRKFLLEV